MKRVIALFLLTLLSLPAHAVELDWRTFDMLPDADRETAEATLYDMWGKNPADWPDWIDPAALYVPTGHRDWLLIVRRPLHAPCGQYSFAIFATAQADGQRALLGDFCAGAVSIIPVAGRDWPDIMVLEGYHQTDDDRWERIDQRLRWNDGQWWNMVTPGAR